MLLNEIRVRISAKYYTYEVAFRFLGFMNSNNKNVLYRASLINTHKHHT